MKKTLISMAAIMALSAATATAQNKRLSKSSTKAEAEKEAKLLEQRIDQMVAATQRIIFIDSVVTDKENFLSKYNLSRDAGSVYSYDNYFKKGNQPNAFVYVNGLADKCYFSAEDTAGTSSIYTCDNFNGQWTTPMKLGGLGNDEGYKSVNYPFMMPDGTTFYFAATGEESIGGYDIFVTRFDSESSSFLKAENIGMPFNSTANDYMYAIDEFNDIGWFATDRSQPEGKVCIYIFIPSETRQLYSPDEYSEEQIRSLANLDCIADTWGNGKERQKAIDRLKAMQAVNTGETAKEKMAFIINDRVTYTKPTDFKSSAGAEQFKQLQALESQRAALDMALAKARIYYATTNTSDRNALKNEILKSEQQIESLELQITQLRKDIRNAEIRHLKQDKS